MNHFILAAALLSATFTTAQVPRVKRAPVKSLEKTFDSRLSTIPAGDPFWLMGTTRGVYLEGYGTVFSAELNLVNGPVVSPFRQVIPKEEVALVHKKKLERIAVLKQRMQELLTTAAAALDTMAPEDRIVLGVTLFYFSWEDTSGLPAQIVMQAERQKLLKGAAAQNSLRVEEF
jgi:hypothetical protein